MKRRYLYIIFVGCAALLPISVNAFLIPPTPVSPTFDAAGDVALTAEGISAKLTTITDAIQQKQAEVMNAIKFDGIKFPFKIDSSLFHKEKGAPVIASARTINPSENIDITDESSIKEGMEKLFYVYPQDVLVLYPQYQEAVKKAYRQKGIEFGNDSMIEMYITVRDLETRMAALKEEFDTLSKCYVEGKDADSDICDSASPNDEELGVWVNYYKINTIYDSMLKITEELMAIKAQYEVAQAILAGITPRMPEDEPEGKTNVEKTSYNDVFTYKQTTVMAFAQYSYGGIALNPVIEPEDENIGITDAKPYEVKTQFSGTAEQFQSSAEANNAYQVLQLAITAHNLKRQLPEYKKGFDEYAKMKKLHQKAIEQLLKSEQCAIKFVTPYYTNAVEVWAGKGCRYSGTNLVCNSGKPVTPENLRNLQEGDTLCDNFICNNYGINKYSNRGGMSGWILSAYKAGKAIKTIELTSDDFATDIIEDSSGSVDDVEKNAKKYENENSSGVSDSSLLRPSNEPKMEAENRQEELMSWQLGAEMAKAIGTDMASTSPKWGKMSGSYPIWTDEKRFYDQYLELKYNNVKQYIDKADLRVVTVNLAMKISDAITDFNGNPELPEGFTIDSVKEYNTQALTNMLPLAEKAVAADAPISTLAATKQKANAAVKKLRDDYLNNLKTLENQKASIYADLDTANIELNDMKIKYNDAVKDRQEAEANAEYQKQSIQIAQERSKQSSDNNNGFEKRAEEGVAYMNKKAEEAKAKEDTALEDVDTKREQIDKLRARLENIDERIARLKSDYAATASALEYQNSVALNKAMDAGLKNMSKRSLAGSSFVSSALNFATEDANLKKLYLMGVIGVADNAVAAFKEAALASVDEAYKKIKNLGDARYTLEGHQQILQIHREMMENMKRVNATFSGSPLLKFGDVKALAKLAAATIVEQICNGEQCYQPDANYFVGIDAKIADFQAPKRIAITYTAPLREIVHFDGVDFDNVIKSDLWKTTRADFLAYGQEIPPVWKRILEPNGFVERDVDVASIIGGDLNQNATDALLWGDKYPCAVGNFVIDIKGGEYKLYQRTTTTKKCTGVKSVRNIMGRGRISFNDGSEFKTGIIESEPSAQSKSNISELAQILTYTEASVSGMPPKIDTGGLGFSSTMVKIMQFLDAAEADDSDDNSEEDTHKMNAYRKALLTRNVFGDYLNFVDMESTYQDAEDELEVKMNETREFLTAKFADIGYIPPADFDLSDEDTYNAIAKGLVERKNALAADGAQQIQKIKPLNEALEEKIKKVKNMLGSLQMDNEELVDLDDNTEPNSELSEKIKTARADAAAHNKYGEEAEKEFQNNMNNFEEPYCGE